MYKTIIFDLDDTLNDDTKNMQEAFKILTKDKYSDEEFKKFQTIDKNYWKENFNIDDEEVMLEQYNLFIETPTNYLQYYLSGFLFEDLYNNASKELGDKFSAVDFHEVILSTGPAPFKILEKQVNKYINSNK